MSKPPDDLPVHLFAGPAELEAWLEENEDADGVWLKIAKKGAPETSVTYAEALEVALCFGWIDSQKRGLDETHFLQRFTPRRPRGRWSKINREKAEALIESGAMRPAGDEGAPPAQVRRHARARREDPSMTQRSCPRYAGTTASVHSARWIVSC